MKPNSHILITRNLKENSALKLWAKENNYILQEQAFISFNAITDLNIPMTDWVFFSSPTGLILYLDNYHLKDTKIAVYSQGTNDALGKYNRTADYIGNGKLNSNEIGKDFFGLIDGESVLFPSSQISTRGIASQGKAAQVIEIVAYETSLNPVSLNTIYDVLIFSSPSNVEGYLVENVIDEQAIVIAFGQTTAKFLESIIEKERIRIPQSTDENDLILLLKSLS